PQIAGWAQVADAVHARGGRIFMQLMHTGRVAHVANLPEGAEVLGPTGDVCPGQMYTDSLKRQPHSTPRAMTLTDIRHAVEEYAAAAKHAIQAGFDGVELHAANGYLIEQFLNPNINHRADRYGETILGRNRFALEIARATSAVIGPDRVGIRISPHGTFNWTGTFPEVTAQYAALLREISHVGLAYVHLVDHWGAEGFDVPDGLRQVIRSVFSGTLILSGAYDRGRAYGDLALGKGDLIALGRPFIANPDLVGRFARRADLNQPDPTTFYTPGPQGYTDYPTLDLVARFN
ncbi:MAG: alkene reductase, partial [Myxococcales bacterium]